MNVCYLRNSADSGAGNLIQWASERGHRLSASRLDRGEPLPSLAAFDVLVILGGVPAKCAGWREEETRLIGEAIAAGKGVVGICLGAQLTAEALGGRLVPARHAESGWWPVKLNALGERHPLLDGVAPLLPLFFFHRNTFELPKDAECLASSEGCAHQIFTYGDRVIGIQAHPEMLAETMRELAKRRATDLPAGPFNTLEDDDASRLDYLEGARRMFWRVLDNLIERLHRAESLGQEGD
ncbi:type 1 glutamine amidotransferase [Halotalea alkalilenta]|uniref:type 1 glutamine amidotransferase n=1 Tax=Halotalea alkalilenta TaxID=376489 RepID=UPI0006939E71|nr:type 1 glutamine amidotransferase [Halotalea alkalilenta]